MSYHKRIVVDIDDTISFTTNRDWANAKPNVQLIQKLNKLFDEGWEVCYVTARGYITFSGNRQDADDHYRDIILNWFSKHNVKYTLLSFDKILAAYYIDDKAITPDEFVDLNIETLVGGLSGAIVERRGNKVYKTHKNSLECAQWYKDASNIIDTVCVHSIIGNTICLDYIEKTGEPRISQIDYIIDEFKKVPEHNNFLSYIKRIEEHLSLYDNDYSDYVLDKLAKYEDFFNSNKSFCHGDFTLDNMILENDTLYLIDPNKPSNLYSSWLLDVSKLLQSSKRFSNMHLYEYYINKYSDIIIQLKLLELTHWIRMRKYSDEKEFIDSNIATLIEEIC